MLTKAQKVEIIAELAAEFKGAGAVIVCDYKGMTVEALEAVRNNAREQECKVRVVKNKLAQLAIKEAGCEALELTDTNLVVWGETQVLPCKVADKAAMDNKDHFAIKAGLIEGQVADLATINAMAKLPTRDELLGMLLNVWNAPVQNFTIGLDALRKKIEEEA